MPDFLGFGASDKPADHDYSLLEQADLVEALWAHEGVERDGARRATTTRSRSRRSCSRAAPRAGCAVELRSLLLINGGLYPDLHRPQPIQEALLDPEQGPKISALDHRGAVRRRAAADVRRALRRAADSADIWEANSRDGGQLIAHRLIRYIVDRREHGSAGSTALEATDVPLSFVWGMLDPVSGAHMAERIPERLPDAPLLALDDVGHWPMLEAPPTGCSRPSANLDTTLVRFSADGRADDQRGRRDDRVVAADAALHRAHRADRAAALGAGYRIYGPAELQRLRTLRELLAAHEIGLGDVAFALRMRARPISSRPSAAGSRPSPPVPPALPPATGCAGSSSSTRGSSQPCQPRHRRRQQHDDDRFGP